MSDSSDDEPNPKRRRGVVNKKNYQRNIIRNARLKGLQDFGSTKRLLRKTDRIYTSNQYAELMLKASKCGRFTVYYLTSDDVLSFKKLWPKSYKRMANSESSGRNVPKKNKQKFEVSKYKQFLYNKETPGKLVASEYIGGVATSTFRLLKTANPPELPAEKAHPLGRVRINKKKTDDIKTLMEYTVGYEAFYETIIQWPTTDHQLPEHMPEAE
ncbi:hypothetical protein WA026_009280 [Henosepilachna vigintioctopunctata]|uniref:Uncharacterized protein n=1 Tax=Henosepilachna vigintioctopunctata TaxID=420089 RepID=A0AAW1UNF0_9CUCU